MTKAMANHIEPRPEVASITPAYHGAFDYEELEVLGLDPDTVLDFSVNSNPYGPSPTVAAALAKVPLDRYPDRQGIALRRALARHLGVGLDQIALGNGTAELLNLIALAYVAAGDRVLIAGPTFGEYARAAQLMGGRVEIVNARPESDFRFDTAALERSLAEDHPRLFFLCRPNNPTGSLLPLEVLVTWAKSQPGTLFVVDEAYLAFSAGCTSALSLGTSNVLVLRSMTKDYALAGLRLGYAVGDPKVIEPLACASPPWNTSSLAQAAGLAALADQAYLRRTLDQLAEAKVRMLAALEAQGLAPLPSSVHYYLLKVGDAAAFRSALLRRRIMVRDCTSFGLPDYVRIATRCPEENSELVEALRGIESTYGEKWRTQ